MDLFETEERDAACMRTIHCKKYCLSLTSDIDLTIYKGHMFQYMIIHMDGPYLGTDHKASGGWIRLRYIPPPVKRSLRCVVMACSISVAHVMWVGLYRF